MKSFVYQLTKLISCLILMVTVSLAQGVFPACAQPADPPCVHGMRIVGEKSIYLSHMGLFNNNCHDYQGIFEVSFEGPKNPQKIYLDTQKRDPSQNEFTIKPTQKFVLPDLASGKVTSFKAEIYTSQYERSRTNPKLLDGDVTAKVKRVLHFRQFKVSAKQPVTSEYLLFGNTSEQLAAHLIAAPPDFDQIVALKTPLSIPDSGLVKAVRLVLPNRPTPNAQANLKQALKPGDKPAVRPNGLEPNKTMEVGTQYFMEISDYEK